MTPKKSAKTVKIPIQRPPKVAAIGIYLFNTDLRPYSLCPTIIISYYLSY